MSLTTSDLSLKGFASIDATMTKHASFVTRALLAQIVEIAGADDIVMVIERNKAATVYKDICERAPSVDRRARMVSAVLTFFDNSPEVAKKFAARKKEWELVNELVEEQDRACVASGTCGVTMATGMARATALEHKASLPQLLKSGLSTGEINAAIKGAVDETVECWEYEDPARGQQIVQPWKEHLELLELF